MSEVFNKHINQDGILVFTSGKVQGERWSNNGGEILLCIIISGEV